VTYTGTSRTRSSRGTLFTRGALKDRHKSSSGPVWGQCSLNAGWEDKGQGAPLLPLLSMEI
jgi:hypothetical protein